MAGSMTASPVLKANNRLKASDIKLTTVCSAREQDKRMTKGCGNSRV
jgi:hypothetical protein